MPLLARRRQTSRPIPAVQLPVSALTAPALLSGATEGQALSASPGTYSGAAPIALAYQWQISDNGTSGWSDSAGMTSITRPALQGAEVNKYVRLRETPSNPVGSGSPQYTGTALVAAANPPGSGTATITFTPTPGVTDYRVAWGAEHDAETYSQDYAGVTGTITVTGLEAGTLHFKVKPLPNGDWYSLGPVVIA